MTRHSLYLLLSTIDESEQSQDLTPHLTSGSTVADRGIRRREALDRIAETQWKRHVFGDSARTVLAGIDSNVVVAIRLRQMKV